MLKTKIVSSQIKAFIDDRIDDFAPLTNISALAGEKLSLQYLYVDEGKDPIPTRPFCTLHIEGDLAPYVTLRDVRYVPVERPVTPGKVDEQYLRTTPGIYPDILTPLRYGGYVVISREKLRSVWIEIDIPKGFAGSGELTLSLLMTRSSVGDTSSKVFEDQPKIAENSISIQVVRADLPEQKTLFTQWFYADCLASYYNVEVWSDKHFEIVENFLRVAAERGRNMVYTPILTPALNVFPPYLRNPSQLVKVELTNGVYSFDFSLLDRWIDILDRVGIKYIEMSHFFHQKPVQYSAKVYATVDGEYKLLFGWDTMALSDEYIRFLREMLTAMIAHLKERGDDERCYYHIADEPTPSTLEQYMSEKEAISDILKGYKIMDALSEIEFYESGAVDIPVPVTSGVEPFNAVDIDERWIYYACNEVLGYSNVYLSMPSWRTRSLGMQMYKFHINGFLHWGYNYYNNRASGNAINPYLDLSGEDWVCAGDTFVVYPDQDGRPLESMRIMTLEEALQDIRAMELCESLYSHAEVVAAMEEELGAEITFKRCAHSEDEMLRVRERINKMIAAKIEK